MQLSVPGHDSQQGDRHLWEGYKECSILPTLLMTLLSRFCMSNKRLYQLSDSEVTSPEEVKAAVSYGELWGPRQHFLQRAAQERSKGRTG